jgi:hypothetical protein
MTEAHNRVVCQSIRFGEGVHVIPTKNQGLSVRESQRLEVQEIDRGIGSFKSFLVSAMIGPHIDEDISLDSVAVLGVPFSGLSPTNSTARKRTFLRNMVEDVVVHQGHEGSVPDQVIDGSLENLSV